MVDNVARALCDAAGRSIYADEEKTSAVCSCCERLPNGELRCVYWESFRGEARAVLAVMTSEVRRERDRFKAQTLTYRHERERFEAMMCAVVVNALSWVLGDTSGPTVRYKIELE